MCRNLLLLAPALILAACSRGPETRETRWPNGTLHEQWTVSRGPDGADVRNGLYQEWNEAGRLLAEGHFAEGRESGPWTTWYGTEPNHKRREGTYVNGMPDGVWHGWMDPNHGHGAHGGHAPPAPPSEGPPGEHPTPQVEERYKMGTPHGVWLGWHADRSVADSSNYVEGKLEGWVVSYHPNGQKALEVFYRDGERVGRQTVWNEVGEVVAVIE